jgi:glycosyltransferase involved in cell wall biosynthesis
MRRRPPRRIHAESRATSRRYLTRSDHVKVSCLMVTLPVPGRFGYFRRSVAAYCAQTHPDRELVIVVDRARGDSVPAIAAHVAALGRDDIRIVELPGTATLGALRNVSIDAARGDVVCQWDDDDLHHPQRVARQLALLVEADAQSVYLEDVLQYFPATRTLWWTNWHATEGKAMPGTLMCRRSAPIRYPESGPEASRGEDSVVAAQLLRLGGFRALAGAPHLFVYVSHGANTYADDHHRMLARELAVSRGLLLRREAQLREGIATFDFGPGKVTVQGYNGAAFTLGLATAAGDASAGVSSR